MITLKRISLLIGSVSTVAFSDIGFAQNQAVSLKQIIEMAERSPEVKAANANSNAAEETHKSSWRKIYLPKINANLTYNHLLEDQGFSFPTINTPAGALDVPPFVLNRDSFMGSVSLVQPLFDPENMLYKSDASADVADSEKLKSSRQLKETQGKAIAYYLQILELRSKRTALEKYAKNMQGRQPEIKRLYQLGQVSDGDVLKIKLGIDDASQGIRELTQKEEFLGKVLASLLGQSSILVPNDMSEELPNLDLPQVSVDPAKREDIESMNKQLEAISKSKSAAKASYLPKVAAVASHYYINNESLIKKDTDVVGLVLSWSAFDGGAGLADAKVSAEKHMALEQQRTLAIDNIQAVYADAVNTLKIKKIEYQERRSAVKDAQQVVEIEFKRLKSGKSTVNNLIDAEDVLKDRLEKASISQIGWYQAWFGGQLASGDLIQVPMQ